MGETKEVQTRYATPTRTPPPQGEWTYEDYKRLPDDGWRYEIIEGELQMVPAPNTVHQQSSFELATAMKIFVQSRGLGKVFIAPIDVMLGERGTPVQPDILFISSDRLSIVSFERIEGAPDLIVEVLSPSNWLADRRDKYELYAKSGVREYWVVDPQVQTVEVFNLQDSRYEQVGRWKLGERASSRVLKGFEIDVANIFAVI